MRPQRAGAQTPGLGQQNKRDFGRGSGVRIVQRLLAMSPPGDMLADKSPAKDTHARVVLHYVTECALVIVRSAWVAQCLGRWHANVFHSLTCVHRQAGSEGSGEQAHRYRQAGPDGERLQAQAQAETARAGARWPRAVVVRRTTTLTREKLEDSRQTPRRRRRRRRGLPPGLSQRDVLYDFMFWRIRWLEWADRGARARCRKQNPGRCGHACCQRGHYPPLRRAAPGRERPPRAGQRALTPVASWTLTPVARQRLGRWHGR